jgi:hypothetical protein
MKKNNRMIMNNKTVHNFTIKLREDRVYDLYLNGKWMVSRGSYDNILAELKTIMEENV